MFLVLQALMYPLLVATKSQSPGRRNAAFAVSEAYTVPCSVACKITSPLRTFCEGRDTACVQASRLKGMDIIFTSNEPPGS
eukprot:1162062-Pelagomonas_calceolata.AAC.4